MPLRPRMSLRLEELRHASAERVNAASANKSFFPATLRAFPSGCVLTEEYRPLAERIRHMPVYADDVWLVTYPKSGTTWSQEMVWLIANNCDFETARNDLLNTRFPFLEFKVITSSTGAEGNTFETVQNRAPPRFIKSHLPKDLLPLELWTKKPKIIYVSRDPKDTAVSYYHHYKLMNGYQGSLDDFMEAFLDDVLVYNPFWDHILDFWKLRNEPNVLFNTYEEMKQDLPAVIRRTARFLGRQLSAEQVAQLAAHLSFSSMRDNPAVNKEEGVRILRQVNGLTEQHRFIRQGASGGWRKEMSAELVRRFDKWSRDRLAGTDYQIGVSGGHEQAAAESRR